MGLVQEIKDNEKKISTTEMKMSIGEIINLYKDEDLILNPEFQRLFRWSLEQKSRLIESILIGIPLPSIFVQQTENGRWEVIDGLQRISTILEFVGLLKDKDGKIVSPSKLKGTKVLPSLENISYECNEDDNCFDRETKLIFKRTPLIIQVVKRDSDYSSKYELFDRLNSGGTPITNQELRNAIFLLEKPEVVRFLNNLSKNEDFKRITSFSDIQIEESYDKEVILRFLAYNNSKRSINSFTSLKEYLDEYMRSELDITQIDELTKKFNNLFRFLNTNFGNELFKRKAGVFKISIFEAVTIGLYKIENYETINVAKIKKKIEEIEKQDWFIANSKQGAQSKKRIDAFLKKSVPYFCSQNQ